MPFLPVSGHRAVSTCRLPTLSAVCALHNSEGFFLQIKYVESLAPVHSGGPVASPTPGPGYPHFTPGFTLVNGGRVGIHSIFIV